MIIPESDRPRRLSLSHRAVVGVSFLVALIIVCIIILAGHDVYLTRKVDSLQMVELENKILKERFNEVGENMARVEARLSRMDTFTTKLRMMTSLEDEGRNQHMMGPESAGQPGAAADAFIDRGWDDGDGHDHGVSAENASTYFPFHEEDSHYILPKLYEIENRLNQISRSSMRGELKLQGLYEIVQDQHLLLRATPSILPTRGWITSRFGFRVDPFTGLRRMHPGIDIATHAGAPIYSPADGVVTYAGVKPGYGKILVIEHGYGVSSRYAHNSQYAVSTGEKVRRGDVISFVGNSGRSTGPHLHYEVRINEIPVDPSNFILDELGPLSASKAAQQRKL